VTVTVSDGPNTVTNNVMITVTNGLSPVVSAIADQSIQKALSPATVVASFTVDTGPLGATNLEVVAATDNTNLVTNIVVTGTAPSFTATATVAPLMTGTALITVFARDQYGTGTSSFHLNVTPTNYPPTLGPIADVTNKVNTAVVIPLTVSDPDTALSSLTFTGTSSNPSLVLDSGITFANNGTTVSATVNPVANASGTAVVTINVSDGTSTASQHFNLTITSVAVQPTVGIRVSGTQVTLTLKGSPNTTYTLQGSSDLKTWTNAGSITTDATGAGQTTVTKSAGHEFYRAVFP